MPTKRDRTRPATPAALSPEQLNAIELLATGQTDAAVAAAAGVGVHRVTVTKWRALPAFAAALNRRRTALFAAATDQLRDLIPKALAAIGDALADPDPAKRTAAAFEFLRAVKLTAGGCIGPTDARDLVAEEVRKRKEVAGTPDDDLVAELSQQPTVGEQFAEALADLEAAAAGPDPRAA